MCEALIRVEDKAPGKPGASMAGDVIAVFDDGHQWGVSEVNVPYWRIVRIPGLPASALATYLDHITQLGGGVSYKRAIGFDLSGAAGEIIRKATDIVEFRRSAAIALLGTTVQRGSVNLTD